MDRLLRAQQHAKSRGVQQFWPAINQSISSIRLAPICCIAAQQRQADLRMHLESRFNEHLIPGAYLPGDCSGLPEALLIVFSGK
jgi:hypothetical protein